MLFVAIANNQKYNHGQSYIFRQSVQPMIGYRWDRINKIWLCSRLDLDDIHDVPVIDGSDFYKELLTKDDWQILNKYIGYTIFDETSNQYVGVNEYGLCLVAEERKALVFANKHDCENFEKSLSFDYKTNSVELSSPC